MPEASRVLHYELQTCLSAQLHCSVWTARDRSNVVVLKMYTDVRTYQTERDALKLLLGVEGIIGILEDWSEVKRMPENTIVNVLVLPYYPQGDLFSLITSPSFDFHDESIIRPLFACLASALLKCHTRSVVHLDLKPENFLMADAHTPILADFGHAATTHISEIKRITGTQKYTAPEVARARTYDGKPADVYSLGITLYVMRAKRFPIRDANSLRVINQSPELFWGSTERAALGVSDGMKELFEGMVRLEPEERMTVDEVLMHPWVRGEEER